MRFLKLCAISLAMAFLFSPSLWAAQPAGGVNADKKIEAEAQRRVDILVAAARKAYTPPEAGITPHPDKIPLCFNWDDPDWDTPLMLSIYRNPYSYGNNLDNYLPCLEEALGGNPKAMLAISMYCYLWGDHLQDTYPDFPPQVHNVYFWRAWAKRITSPGWVYLRLGDLHGRWPDSSLELYRQAAELGNAEAMYNYYKISGKRQDYLWRSAALGYAKAAFMLGEELGKLGDEKSLELSRRYTWLAALNGDEWGLLHSSFAFYKGDFADKKVNCEQGYLYALLNLRYQYGVNFTSQKPDNICMLDAETISRVEALADRWQADYDQRRLPAVLRARYYGAPHVEALQNELGDLIDKLGFKRLAPGEAFLQSNAALLRQPQPEKLPWHLGFYNEDSVSSYAGAGVALADSALPDDGEGLLRQFWLYVAVIAVMLAGAGLIFYGRMSQKKQDFSRQSLKTPVWQSHAAAVLKSSH